MYLILYFIGCTLYSTLCVLSMKTIGSDSFYECVISHGMTLSKKPKTALTALQPQKW